VSLAATGVFSVLAVFFGPFLFIGTAVCCCPINILRRCLICFQGAGVAAAVNVGLLAAAASERDSEKEFSFSLLPEAEKFVTCTETLGQIGTKEAERRRLQDELKAMEALESAFIDVKPNMMGVIETTMLLSSVWGAVSLRSFPL
jgi:hypothetical protein